MRPEALEGDFTDAPVQAARAFRAALEAMARPGTLHQVTGARPPAPLSPAAGALLLTLCDGETPLHLAGATDCDAVRDWVTFHAGAPLVPAEEARFALGRWEALQPLARFALGEPSYPDRSATLIVEMDVLSASGARLTGPGIRSEAFLPLPEREAFKRNSRLFPLGLDFFFCAGSTLAALPRSTKIGEVA
ncbi:phosphonate C-P lyase system protein PhnH [Aliiruegeria lutimaris]|uniref:Alpha-D-ribose 1-methylphosphonate 5-triphosphate synthase subunit PhnH n=1 Tax=Aliiruegeria lutimaris TaxID=571298 RepID=A0A1G9BX65_9RHOB|nr:phosphonate C-P lyase system protein PhnH [Aliiruegeria lutimaris]SDK43973.1 alpha-D-ribose 1-methylphosphonate 5-triphosphate synthase subunit PhnH [Aliiruegeria lutimaris]